MQDQPSEGGVRLDRYIVDINGNYINYINYNTKIVKETDVDALEVIGTGTTGHYLTLDFPCDNNKF